MRGHVRMVAQASALRFLFWAVPKTAQAEACATKGYLASEDARQTSFAAHRRSDWRSRAVQTNSVSRAEGQDRGAAFSVDFSLRGLNSTQAKSKTAQTEVYATGGALRFRLLCKRAVDEE